MNSRSVLPEVGTFDQLFHQLSAYIQLNASFSDDLGIFDGKASASLFFALSQNHKWCNEVNISFNLLEEIVSQLDAHTPVIYGSGLVGIGALIELFVEIGVIDENPNEILSEIHNSVLTQIYSAKCTDIGIGNGLSGLGLYLLSRFRSCYQVSAFEQNRMRECIVSIVDQISDLHRASKSSEHDILSISYGMAGTLFFLQNVREMAWYVPIVDELISELRHKIFLSLTVLSPSWTHLDGWISILLPAHGTNPIQVPDGWLDDFFKLISWCRTTEQPFAVSDNLHRMVWLKELNFQLASEDIDFVIKRVTSSSIQYLSKRGVKNMFPYSIGNQSIPMGAATGVTGCALALWALDNDPEYYLRLWGYTKIDSTSSK